MPQERRHLLQLPDEMLLQILGCLEGDSTSLCKAALVSQRLAALVHFVLFREIHLDFAVGLASRTRRYRRFHRSLDERPSIAQLTRVAILTWRTDLRLKDGYSPIIALLARLEALRGLYLDIQWDSKLWNPASLYQIPFLRLQNLVLCLPGFTAIDVIHFLKLPSLQSLKVIDLKPVASSANLEQLEILCHRSNVERLHLGWLPIDFPSMHSILLFTTSLDYLLAVMPGFCREKYGFRDKYMNAMSGLFSPNQLQMDLCPIQGTLTRLDLSTLDMFWSRHDGSRLDLSAFEVLEDARISSIFFFKSDEPHQDRLGTWRLLPKSIKEVDVDFSGYEGFLYSEDRLRGGKFSKSWLTQISAFDYAWLSELALHKMEHLPELRSVTIVENGCLIFGSRDYRRIDWPCPKDLLAEFEANNISIKPKDWDEIEDDERDL